MTDYFVEETVKRIIGLFDSKATLRAKELLSPYSECGCIWKKEFAPSNKIGNCTNLFRKLQPDTYFDFCQKYFEYAENNTVLPIRERGLTRDEFCGLVKDYYTKGNDALSKTGKHFSLADFANDALCHIITETFDGKMQEVFFIKYLRGLGYECEFIDGREDAVFGIDIKVKGHNGKDYGIQIKPFSFLVSKRRDVQEDRVGLCHKYWLAMEYLGMETFYAVYKKDKEKGTVTWMKNANGGYKFKISEIFSYDSLEKPNYCITLPLNYDFEVLKQEKTTNNL